MSEVRPPRPDREAEAIDASSADFRLIAGQMLEGLQRSVEGGTAFGASGRLGGADGFPEALYRMRRARDETFPGFFADPSWDMLLDLYEQRRRGRAVTISSACLASAVPPTTALRHLELLAASGFVERRPCPHDARSTYVELSAKGAEMIDAWVVSALRILVRWATDAWPQLFQPDGEPRLFAWEGEAPPPGDRPGEPAPPFQE